MPKFKNIKIKKRGGGTRTQRVKVLASGKYRFVKNIGKTKTSKKTKKTSRKGGGKRMAKKKRRRSNKIPLATVGGVIASPFLGSNWSGGVSVVQRLMEGNTADAGKIALRHYFGIDSTTGVFEPMGDGSFIGWIPVAVGAIVSKFVGGRGFFGFGLNVNRRIPGKVGI